MEAAATNGYELSNFLLMQAEQAREIGERIAQARLRAGMTQEQLGDLIGKSTRSVQDYEGGKTILWKDLRPIATLTEVPVDWLIHGSREETDIKAMLRQVLLRLDDLERKLSRDGEQSSEEGKKGAQPQNDGPVHGRSDLGERGQ